MIITRYVNGVAVSEEELKGYTAVIDVFGQTVNRVRARVDRAAGRRRKSIKRNNVEQTQSSLQIIHVPINSNTKE